MPVAADAPDQVAPNSAVAAYLIERHYRWMGCDSWNTRRVLLLCGKFGDTDRVMAERMRLKMKDFKRRMEEDSWTEQDGLILTLLEREIDFIKGGKAPTAFIV